MAASTQIALSDYLQQTYRSDREFVDCEVVERKMGNWEHARLQALIGGWLVGHKREWGVLVAAGWRTLTSPSRVRIPDLTVVLRGPQPAVLVEAPLLVIEVLSPDDTYSDTERRAQDYQQMGAHAIWIIDPQTRTGRMCIGANWTAAVRLEVPGTEIFLDLVPLFGSLDEHR